MNSITPVAASCKREEDLSPELKNYLHLWRRFYPNLDTVTELNWPGSEEWGHPYKFAWHDDVTRDRVVNCLCRDNEGRTDLPTAQVLRYLLWLFRAAQYRKKPKLGDWFDKRRWRWVTNTEAMTDTGLSERQLRRAVKILEERGLIRVVREYSLNNVPHYRPSADLFRLCHWVCKYWEPNYFDGWLINASPEDKPMDQSDWHTYKDDLRTYGDEIFRLHFPRCEKSSALLP